MTKMSKNDQKPFKTHVQKMTFSKRKKRKKNIKKTQKVNDSCCIKVKKTSKTTKNDQK